MLNNVFLKTLYEKRWMLIGWSVVIVFFTLFIVLVFPVFRDTFGESLKDVPDSMKSLLGDAKTYQTLNGYVDIQVIYQMIFLPVIMGIILCTGLIAGKEEQGVIQTLLAQPIKRRRVYLDSLLASMVIIAVASLSIFIATWLGALIIGEPLAINRLLQATFATWLVTVLVSTFGYSLGAITAKRGLAGMVTGIVVFLGYVITALAPSVKYLKIPNYFSPFKYFNTPSVIQNGLKLSNILIMVIVSVIFIVIGYIFFVKRDIYQK
ncbi:MAG: ABC transporter permease [Prolixibacteraceae bacterium]|nr:ABC transporter permease [Prolixibacteraceae bacterium]